MGSADEFFFWSGTVFSIGGNYGRGCELVDFFATCPGLTSLKPGFHSNLRNARKVLRTKNCAVKINSTQATRETQENYSSEKQQYANASDEVTQVVLANIAKRKNRIDPVLHARNASRQPIGIHDRSSQLSASINLCRIVMMESASACVASVFRFTQRTQRTQRNACVILVETRLNS